MLRWKLWIQTDILGVWTDDQDAKENVLRYIDEHPDEAALIHYTAFRPTLDGLKIVHSFTGADEIREHFSE